MTQQAANCADINVIFSIPEDAQPTRAAVGHCPMVQPKKISQAEIDALFD
jgi:hypothetical protein